MTTEPHNKLERVRTLLKQLGNGVADLAQNYADILDSPNLRDALSKFRQAYEESVTRLENPNFTIATIGTTSSGKSTIVNALIGRKIAPIEAGEMSGGILTIKHSKEFKLSVAETENAQWETGTWQDLTDGEIYDRIRNGVMFPYHQARQKQELIAPQVTAYIPILPAEDPSLLGLPEGIGIEFIDLPGLKSIQDKDNLKVIQQQVNKAFSLVALDYLQVDDRHRKRLLEELKKVVEFLQGRTDSMIFILNRVDRRGQDDIAIAERIAQLQLEIQETLNLEELPDIIPLSGRLLYYAQCAWGATAINSNSAVDTATRQHYLKGMLGDFSSLIPINTNLEDLIHHAQCAWGNKDNKNNFSIDAASRSVFLDAMFKDCSHLIRLHTDRDKKLKNWFRELEDRIDSKQPIDDKSMIKVLYYIYDWSGGNKLWQCMRDRVRESFTELIVLPILIDVLDRYKVLSDAIENKYSKKLDKEIENIRRRFHQIIKEKFEILQQKDEKYNIRLEKQKNEDFNSLDDTVRQVEEDLIEQIIYPVRNAFEQVQGTYELEEELTDVVSRPKAKAIAKAYDLVYRKLSKFDKTISGYSVKKVRQDDKEGVRTIEEAERAVRSLYYAMRQAIIARAEFTLQEQMKQFATSLQTLVTKLTQELKSDCQQKFPDLDLERAIFSASENYLAHNSLKLSAELFSLPNNVIQYNTTSGREVVGTKMETEFYIETMFFVKEYKTRKVPKTVYNIIEYLELRLPNYKIMVQQWAEAIAGEEQKLRNILENWFVGYSNLVIAELDRVIDCISEVVKTSEYWKNFEKKVGLVSETYLCLQEEIIANN